MYFLSVKRTTGNIWKFSYSTPDVKNVLLEPITQYDLECGVVKDLCGGHSIHFIGGAVYILQDGTPILSASVTKGKIQFQRKSQGWVSLRVNNFIDRSLEYKKKEKKIEPVKEPVCIEKECQEPVGEWRDACEASYDIYPAFRSIFYF